MIIPVIDVEEFLIWRKGDAVGTGQVFTHQRNLPVLRCEDTAERQFLARIIEKLRQTEWRISEIKRAIATINEIVGTVQPFTFKFVRDHGELAIGLEPHHAPISVLVYRQATFPIERQTIRAGLTVLRNIRAFVTAFLAEYSELSISLRRIFVNRVVVWIAEE